jgi:ribosomal protein L9
MNDVAKTEAELQKVLAEIKGIVVEMKGKVNDKGHLFAGIHKNEITEAVRKQKNIHLSADHVILEKPIKEVGEHAIIVKVGDREVSFKLTIKAE